jgi:NAD(P)-dependent dehydrogenase (short-subunit alcohol dehydrogenase family)
MVLVQSQLHGANQGGRRMDIAMLRSRCVEKSLATKNIIVTGASRGLGKRIAATLWEKGANLLVVARNSALLELTLDQLKVCGLPGQQAHSVAVDLASAEAVETIMNKATGVWHRLDVLINNAAMLGPIGPVWENNWVSWQEAIHVNLIVPVALCRACIPWMNGGGGGRIINISGGGATGSRPNFTAYAVAKTGLARFTEIVSEETKHMNIQMNCIAPGALNTDMLQDVLNAGPEKVGEKEYTQALRQSESGGADPGCAAELCAFLASSDSDGITGKLISSVWDPWRKLPAHVSSLENSDIYTLRRIVPKDRNMSWE